jgi:hypothetical protein
MSEPNHRHYSPRRHARIGARAGQRAKKLSAHLHDDERKKNHVYVLPRMKTQAQKTRRSFLRCRRSAPPCDSTASSTSMAPAAGGDPES